MLAGLAGWLVSWLAIGVAVSVFVTCCVRPGPWTGCVSVCTWPLPWEVLRLLTRWVGGVDLAKARGETGLNGCCCLLLGITNYLRYLRGVCVSDTVHRCCSDLFVGRELAVVVGCWLARLLSPTHVRVMVLLIRFSLDRDVVTSRAGDSGRRETWRRELAETLWGFWRVWLGLKATLVPLLEC
jgi:hypothetical protein